MKLSWSAIYLRSHFAIASLTHPHIHKYRTCWQPTWVKIGQDGTEPTQPYVSYSSLFGSGAADVCCCSASSLFSRSFSCCSMAWANSSAFLWRVSSCSRSSCSCLSDISCSLLWNTARLSTNETATATKREWKSLNDLGLLAEVILFVFQTFAFSNFWEVDTNTGIVYGCEWYMGGRYGCERRHWRQQGRVWVRFMYAK